jgi:hypothetical protein
VTGKRTIVQLRNQSQSEPRIPQNTKAIETPKVPSFGFYLNLFRPLALVPIKRVLGVPLANEISEVKAQPQRALTIIEFNCASFNNGWDFRRKFASHGTSPSPKNGTAA